MRLRNWMLTGSTDAAGQLTGSTDAAGQEAARDRADESQRLWDQINHRGDRPNDVDDDAGGAARDGGVPVEDDPVAALRRTVGDDPIDLRPGEMACAVCGMPTAATTDPALLVFAESFGQPAPRMPRYVADRVALTRCTDCAARQVLAGRIVGTHRWLQSSFGQNARDFTEAALSALAVVGVDMPDVDGPAPVIRALMKRMGRPDSGFAQLWFRDLGPATVRGRCAPWPWASVPLGTRSRIRKAAADYLADLVHVGEPDRQLHPPKIQARPGELPIDSGCLFCGRSTVILSAIRVADWGGPTGAAEMVWARHAWDARLLGGGPVGPLMKYAGHLCPECEREHANDHTMGPTLLERCCAAYQETAGRPDRAHELRLETYRVIGWAAVVAQELCAGRPEPEPPDRPWGFLRFPDEQSHPGPDPIGDALQVLKNAREQGYEFPELEAT